MSRVRLCTAARRALETARRGVPGRRRSDAKRQTRQAFFQRLRRELLKV